jgi:predicted transcriptional regulator
MTSVIETLKKTEKEISALKKALAEKESLLPGLRLAASLNGNGVKENAKENEENDDALELRLRMGDSPRKALELLAEKGDDVPYSAILKVVDNNPREARYAVRNLVSREFATRNEEKDTAHVTQLGRNFIKKYREKHDSL